MLKDGLDMLSPDCTVQLYLTWAKWGQGYWGGRLLAKGK